MRANAPDPDIAAIAAAIGQPARASMLSALLCDASLSVSELARRGNVSPATASLHLARLTDAGLVVGQRSGRTHRYRLAGVQAAQALEALQRLAQPPPTRSLAAATAAKQIRLARSCYDHLAGKLGVAITDALVGRGHLQAGPDAFSLTPNGEQWFASQEIDVDLLRVARRGFALRCLDWSERQPHLAGALGAALLARSFDAGWVSRRRGNRALTLTAVGARTLHRELGLEYPRTEDP